MKKNKYGNIEEQELQESIDTQDNYKFNISGDSENIYAKREEKHRYYVIDKDGNVEGPLYVDENPGDITKDVYGNELTGKSENEAYQINSIEDLCAVSNMSNNGTDFSGKYIKLMKNLDFKSDISYVNGNISELGEIQSFTNYIDLKNYLTDEAKTGFVPVLKLSGILDGNNKIISNMYINDINNNCALIKENSGKIINLEIKGGKVIGKENCAGIVSKNLKEGEITNCKSSIEVNTSNDGEAGIACYNYGKIINCSFNGILKKINEKEQGWNYGGITAINQSGGEITNCVNNGEIKGSYNTGGIVGNNNGGKISNCSNKFNFNFTIKGYQKGGICGNNQGTVENCYNIGNINVRGTRNAGIVGGNGEKGIINKCYNTGNIIGTGYNIGGICGENNGGKINDCYNNGDVYNKIINGADVAAGGIAGLNKNGEINNCYNIGNINISHKNGKIDSIAVKGEDGVINNCYYIETGTKSEYGISKTENEMKTADFIKLLDTNGDVWKIDSGKINKGFPVLNWQN